MSCTGHSHDHGDAPEEVTLDLNELIDFTGVTCLNENISGSSKAILKSHENRYSPHPTLLSTVNGDPELLFHIPFTETVSITTISIRGPPSLEEISSSSEFRTSGPRHVGIFVNRDDLDWATAEEMSPAMDLELVHPNHEAFESTIDYFIVNRGRFQNISSITLYVRDNFGGDGCVTEISYVGFKGKAMNAKRKAVNAMYESIALKDDHAVPADEMNLRFGI